MIANLWQTYSRPSRQVRSHLERGPLRPLEIGEAAKALPDDLLRAQPSVPWRQIARNETAWHTVTSARLTPSCKLPPTMICWGWKGSSGS